MDKINPAKMQVVIPRWLFELLEVESNEVGISKGDIIRDSLKYRFWMKQEEKKRENNT